MVVMSDILLLIVRTSQTSAPELCVFNGSYVFDWRQLATEFLDPEFHQSVCSLPAVQLIDDFLLVVDGLIAQILPHCPLVV
jgi:hypothetical protein